MLPSEGKRGGAVVKRKGGGRNDQKRNEHKAAEEKAREDSARAKLKELKEYSRCPSSRGL